MLTCRTFGLVTLAAVFAARHDTFAQLAADAPAKTNLQIPDSYIQSLPSGARAFAADSITRITIDGIRPRDGSHVPAPTSIRFDSVQLADVRPEDRAGRAITDLGGQTFLPSYILKSRPKTTIAGGHVILEADLINVNTHPSAAYLREAVGIPELVLLSPSDDRTPVKLLYTMNGEVHEVVAPRGAIGISGNTPIVSLRFPIPGNDSDTAAAATRPDILFEEQLKDAVAKGKIVLFRRFHAKIVQSMAELIVREAIDSVASFLEEISPQQQAGNGIYLVLPLTTAEATSRVSAMVTRTHEAEVLYRHDPLSKASPVHARATDLIDAAARSIFSENSWEPRNLNSLRDNDQINVLLSDRIGIRATLADLKSIDFSNEEVRKAILETHHKKGQKVGGNATLFGLFSAGGDYESNEEARRLELHESLDKLQASLRGNLKIPTFAVNQIGNGIDRVRQELRARVGEFTYSDVDVPYLVDLDEFDSYHRRITLYSEPFHVFGPDVPTPPEPTRIQLRPGQEVVTQPFRLASGLSLEHNLLRNADGNEMYDFGDVSVVHHDLVVLDAIPQARDRLQPEAYFRAQFQNVGSTRQFNARVIGTQQSLENITFRMRFVVQCEATEGWIRRNLPNGWGQ